MLHLNLNSKDAFNRPTYKAFYGNDARISLDCLERNVINWPLCDDAAPNMFCYSNWSHIENIDSSICQNRTSYPRFCHLQMCFVQKLSYLIHTVHAKITIATLVKFVAGKNNNMSK